MAGQKPDASQIAQSWDAYWHGAKHGAAFAGGGTSHPLILSFWDEFFKAGDDQAAVSRIVDVASGSGAVVECAKSAFSGRLTDFSCVDISPSAISALTQRFPGVHGVVADARDIPLDSAAYDIVTSQFGIEYAGLEAMDELTRLIAPGGRLALLLHHAAGGIFRQCAASLDAINKLQQAGFIDKSIAVFEQGFAVSRGADRSAYDAAAKEFVPAIRALESIMQQHGRDVADGTIVRLYQDVRTIHGRIQHYEPSEVLQWLRSLQDEVDSYAGRMASMCNAAIDADTFGKLCDRLRGQEFTMLRHEPLVIAERGVALAWALVAARA